MHLLDLFSRGQRREQPYAKVSEEEVEEQENDEMLSQHSDSRVEILGLQRSNRNLKRILAIVITAFCLLGGLLILDNVRSREESLMIPQILKTPIPPMPLTNQTFHLNTTYTTRPSPSTNHAWNSLLPPGRGFIFVTNSSLYSLPPGERTYLGEIYSVSLFHQLHCLGQLRKYYWMLIEGVEAEDWKLLGKMVKALTEKGGEHVGHCFDYLRQGIMCAGDLALEWPRGVGVGGDRAVDGWGVVHECRSWEHISEYMQEHHFNASTNSDIAPDHPMISPM